MTTTWRHIQTEQPEPEQLVIVWDSQYDEPAFAWRSHNGDFRDEQGRPVKVEYWQPSPKRPPTPEKDTLDLNSLGLSAENLDRLKIIIAVSKKNRQIVTEKMIYDWAANLDSGRWIPGTPWNVPLWEPVWLWSDYWQPSPKRPPRMELTSTERRHIDHWNKSLRVKMLKQNKKDSITDIIDSIKQHGVSYVVVGLYNEVDELSEKVNSLKRDNQELRNLILKIQDSALNDQAYIEVQKLIIANRKIIECNDQDVWSIHRKIDKLQMQIVELQKK